MVIREVQDRDFVQLAEMRWTHAVEDDETYGEHNTDGVTKSVFIEEFVAFLYTNKEYKIFVAEYENAKNSFGNVCISYSDNSHPECKA